MTILSSSAPIAFPPTSKREARALALLFALGVGVRLWCVSEFSASAGDGLQYYTLAQELRMYLHYGYDDPPSPPTYTRLPGYPILMAFQSSFNGIGLRLHLTRASRTNVVCDVLSLAAVLAILYELGAGSATALAVAIVAFFCCPILLVLASYGLTESPSTCGTMLALWLAVRAHRNARAREAIACGVVTGLALLMRADALTMLPGLLLLFAFTEHAHISRRLRQLELFVLALLLTFAPWPIRNLIDFGKPHPLGAEWMDNGGRELRTGPIAWMRTWSSASPGQGFLQYAIVNYGPIPWPQILTQGQFDKGETARTRDVLKRLDHEGLTGGVDDAFRALAKERATKHPWRTYVTLPWKRLGALYAPVPSYELPWDVVTDAAARTRWWRRFDLALYAAALLGALRAFLRGSARVRRILSAAVLLVVARSLLHAFAVPALVGQRYLAEVMPIFVLLAACSVASWKDGAPER